MTLDELKNILCPHIGGIENICHIRATDNKLYVRLKDQGAVDLPALNRISGVSSVTLNQGKLRILMDEPIITEDEIMAAKNYKKSAEQIVQNVGGNENISLCFHCVTRLRFELHDKTKVNEQALKGVNGVVTTQWVGEQLQVVIGTDVSKYFEEIEKLLPKTAIGATVDENLDQNVKKPITPKSIGMAILDYLSGSISPILPILTACGLVSVLATLAEQYGSDFIGEGTITILDAIYDAGFYFMPIFLSVSAARHLKTNEFIAALMGAIMVYPTLMGVEGITFLGFSMPTYTYTSTMFPAYITVFVLCYVEKFFKKIIPQAVSVAFVPFFTALVMGFVTIFITAPLGAYIGTAMGNILLFINNNFGIIALPLFSALFPILVMTGMHAAILLPLIMAELTTFGFTIWGSTCLAYMPAMAGATLAVAYRTKNKDMKQIATSSGITCLIAVSEPCLYGVLLRLRRPLISCMIAAAIGGFFVNLLQIERYAMALFNVFTFVVFIGDNIWNMVYAIIVFAGTLILSFIITLLIGWEDPETV